MKYALLTVTLFWVGISAAQEADRVRFSGDFRYRHEYIDTETLDRVNHRNRIRARFKADGEVNDKTDVTLRMSTGSLESTTTNQTLDGAYANKNFELDMAYIFWRPNAETDVFGGKIKNTFYIPGGSELLWDADVTPEGVAANWRGDNFFVNAAAYWFDERNAETGPTANDTMQYSAQVGFICKGDEARTAFGLGHHVFSPMKGRTVIGGAEGNTLDGSNQYLNGYEISEAFVEWAPQSQPWLLYAHATHNSAADEENTGYLIGAGYGRLNERGDWRFDLSYRNTEADSVLGFLSDSDFADGETDSRGYRLNLSSQLGPAAIASLTYMASETNVSQTPVRYDRAMLDLVFAF